MHARIYVIAQNKGGTAKTTSTLQIGYMLAKRGRKTLIIDTDSQCNSTYSLLGDIPDEESETSTVKTLADVILGVNNDPKQRIGLVDIITPLKQQNGLFLAPGSIRLSSADILLAASGGRERILRRAIDVIRSEFDYILMDTPPTLGLIPVNAYVAAGSEANITSNGIIITICPQVYSVLGIRTLENAINQIRTDIELPMPIFGVLCANAKRTKNAASRLDQVLEYFGNKVFPYVIPVNEKIEEAADLQMSIYDYAPKSTGAIAYTKLTNALMYRAGDIALAEATVYLKNMGLWDEIEQGIWEVSDAATA